MKKLEDLIEKINDKDLKIMATRAVLTEVSSNCRNFPWQTSRKEERKMEGGDFLNLKEYTASVNGKFKIFIGFAAQKTTMGSYCSRFAEYSFVIDDGGKEVVCLRYCLSDGKGQLSEKRSATDEREWPMEIVYLMMDLFSKVHSLAM